MDNLKALEQKHKELGEEIEKLKQAATVSYKRPRAEFNKLYNYITDNGFIYSDQEAHMNTDQLHYDLGNYFLTLEEAERARDRQLAYVRMTDAIREANEGWVADVMDVNQRKYYPYLDEGIVYWKWKYLGATLPIEMLCSEDARNKLGDSLNEDFKIWMGVE